MYNYPAIEKFYQVNYTQLLDWNSPLRPSKSCPKNGAAGVEKFHNFYKKTGSRSFTEDEVLTILKAENVQDGDTIFHQNLRVMRELGFLIPCGGKKYKFTEEFISFVESNHSVGCYIIEKLMSIASVDDLTMYFNFLICVMREAAIYGQVIQYRDSALKFEADVPDEQKRKEHQKRVYSVYGFKGDEARTVPENYTPNISYFCHAVLKQLGILVKSETKIDNMGTLVLTPLGEIILNKLDENLSQTPIIKKFMNIVPSNYNKEIAPVIYFGAPGTGKTSFVQTEIYDKYHKENRYFLTFHQSFSYEEFVEGLKPILEDATKDVKYHIEKGVFYNACERAAILAGYQGLKDCIDNDTPEGRTTKFSKAIAEKKTVLLCIDEINRGNVASIFGDLISLIETSKRLGAGTYEMTATLPYSQEEFGVPANLFIVGTMNTADRSIQLLDSALRRRFKFEELVPNYNVFKIADGDAVNILKRINANIRCLLNKDSQIGHSYLMNATSSKEILSVIFNKIIPLLEEYFYDDLKKVRFILNENDNTTYPFYIKDDVAKEAYNKYINQNDIEDEDREFYILNPDIEKLLNLEADDELIASSINEKCKNYLLHLLGKSEKSEQE